MLTYLEACHDVNICHIPYIIILNCLLPSAIQNIQYQCSDYQYFFLFLYFKLMSLCSFGVLVVLISLSTNSTVLTSYATYAIILCVIKIMICPILNKSSHLDTTHLPLMTYNEMRIDIQNNKCHPLFGNVYLRSTPPHRNLRLGTSLKYAFLG